ncbi:Signal transduction histidine-protein kinase BaeS [bacterium HR39]|nr:Signal transduction histidine-protein kinase BaeS [bacterium HR39]
MAVRTSTSRLPAPAASWLPATLERPLRVLLVEDDAADAGRVLGWLAREPRVEAECAGTIAAALARLARDAFDVVLVDLVLPDAQGLPVVEAVLQAAPQAAVVVLTGLEGAALELAHLAVARGAADFLPKRGANGGLLVRALWNARESVRIRARLRELEREPAGGPWRADGRDVHLPEGLAALVGLPSLLPARHLLRRLPRAERRRLLAAIRRARSGAPLTLQIVDGAGRAFLVEVHAGSRSGGPHGAVHVVPAVPAPAELREAFAAALAHEVRTPLAAIRGALSLAGLADAHDLPPRIRELLDMAGRNAARLEALVTDLLDLQSAVEGDAEGVEPVDLAGLLREAVAGRRSEAEGRAVFLELAAPPSLPARAQKRRLVRLFDRLVGHGVRAALPGAGLEVQLLCEPPRLRLALPAARSASPGCAPDPSPATDGPPLHIALCGAELDLAIARGYARLLGLALHVQPAEEDAVAVVLDLSPLVARGKSRP